MDLKSYFKNLFSKKKNKENLEDEPYEYLENQLEDEEDEEGMCPTCGAIISITSTECCECGESLEPPEDDYESYDYNSDRIIENRFSCPTCGSEIPDNVTQCDMCGEDELYGYLKGYIKKVLILKNYLSENDFDKDFIKYTIEKIVPDISFHFSSDDLKDIILSDNKIEYKINKEDLKYILTNSGIKKAIEEKNYGDLEYVMDEIIENIEIDSWYKNECEVEDEHVEAECPTCGAIISITSTECHECGQRFEDFENENYSTNITREKGYCNLESKIEDEEEGMCPNCGAIISITSTECCECGESLEPSEDDYESYSSNNEIEDQEECPICGAENLYNSSECDACGEPFDYLAEIVTTPEGDELFLKEQDGKYSLQTEDEKILYGEVDEIIGFRNEFLICKDKKENKYKFLNKEGDVIGISDKPPEHYTNIDELISEKKIYKDDFDLFSDLEDL